MKTRSLLISMVAVLAFTFVCQAADKPAAKKPAKPRKARPPKHVVAPPEKTPKIEPGTWHPLFNGKDLKGWAHKNGGIFMVRDGCLVGTQTDGKGGDLYTTTEWANFELRVTYRMTWPANSGFWYRWNPADGRGYQFDVLKYKRPVAFSGSLYCPGKLFIFANLKEELEDQKGWNEAHVYANGTKLIQWLNGHKIGETDDKTFAKGRIGIQVHPGGFKGMEVIVKRIEVRPLKEGDKPSTPAVPEKKGEK